VTANPIASNSSPQSFHVGGHPSSWHSVQEIEVYPRKVESKYSEEDPLTL
jgi:hypothetical protein